MKKIKRVRNLVMSKLSYITRFLEVGVSFTRLYLLLCMYKGLLYRAYN